MALKTFPLSTDPDKQGGGAIKNQKPTQLINSFATDLNSSSTPLHGKHQPNKKYIIGASKNININQHKIKARVDKKTISKPGDAQAASSVAMTDRQK